MDSVQNTEVEPGLVSGIIGSATVSSSLSDRASRGSSGYAEQDRMIAQRTKRIDSLRTVLAEREGMVRDAICRLDSRVSELIK